MGKGRIFGSVAAFALICAAATWNGCGSSSNDQGISFRSLGFFSDNALTKPVTQECDPFRDTTIVPANGNDIFLGLQNNMSVGVNLDRIDLSYHINGSTLAIPNDVFAVSTRLGSASGEASSSIVAVPVVLVSPQIMQFLNDNSSRLPDLPFTMIVFATAVGTSDAGEQFEANRVSYEVLFAAQSGGCGAVATPGLPTPTPGESIAG